MSTTPRRDNLFEPTIKHEPITSDTFVEVDLPNVNMQYDHSTTYVLDLTKVDPFAKVGETILTVIHLADILDFLNCGFRVIPRKEDGSKHQKTPPVVAPSPRIDVPGSGEVERSSEWMWDANLPVIKQKMSAFGLRRKKQVIIPEEEIIDAVLPIILIITSETPQKILELRRTLFGSDKKIGLLEREGLGTKLDPLSELIKIVPAMCCCPLVDELFYRPQFTKVCYEPNGKAVDLDLFRSRCSIIRYGEVSESYRTAQHTCLYDFDSCHDHFFKLHGSLDYLRKISQWLSPQVLYIDGRVIGSKAIPMIMERAMGNTPAVSVLLKADPRDEPINESESSGITSCNGCTNKYKNQEDLNYTRTVNCSNRYLQSKDTFITYTLKVPEGSLLSKNILSLIPLDSNKEPIPSWRTDEVWSSMESENDLPRIPWHLPDNANPIDFLEAPKQAERFLPSSCNNEEGVNENHQTVVPEKPFYNVLEMESCGVVFLSSSVVDFWIKQNFDETLNIDYGVEEGVEADEGLIDLWTKLTNNEVNSASCDCAEKNVLQESRTICQTLSLQQRLSLLQIVKEKQNLFNAAPLPVKKDIDRLCSKDMLKALPSDSSIMDLVCFLTATQADERSFEWGCNRFVEDISLGRFPIEKPFFNPDLWHAMQFYGISEKNYPSDVPKDIRPEVFATQVQLVEAPCNLLTFWITNRESTEECCKIMLDTILDAACAMTAPTSSDCCTTPVEGQIKYAGSETSMDNTSDNDNPSTLCTNTRRLLMLKMKEIMKDGSLATNNREEWYVQALIPSFLGTVVGEGWS